MLLILIPYLICVKLEVDGKKIYSISSAPILFEAFVKDYDKKYETQTEYQDRFYTFLDNLKEINHKNVESNSTVEYGITQFSDMTRAEQAEFFTSVLSVNEFDYQPVTRIDMELGDVTVPKVHDWRNEGKVTAPRDTGKCAAGWAFSAVSAIESQYAIKYGELIRLSSQQLLDCTGYDANCQRGSPSEAIDKLSTMDGIVTAAAYPYSGRKDHCYASGKKIITAVKPAKVHKVHNEEYLKNLVYLKGPIIVGMQTGHEFFEYKRGVATAKDLGCFGREPLKLSVVIVGYGVDKTNIDNPIPYWIIKHSFGAKWGENGYFRLVRDKNACLIRSYVVEVEID